MRLVVVHAGVNGGTFQDPGSPSTSFTSSSRDVGGTTRNSGWMESGIRWLKIVAGG